MERANIVIIGAGIVGLAIASEISMKSESVYVFEKGSAAGMETSSHNSGVIHSGIHYPKGTLKAILSVRGNSMIYGLCEKYGIACKKTGKLTVASNDSEAKDLERLMKNGYDNGVEGMRMIDGPEVRNIEPNIRVERALYTPSTGIIEPYDLMNYFRANALKNGATFAMSTEVTGIKKTFSGYVLEGISEGQKFSVEAETIINSAGLYSDRIAAMAGIDIDRAGYRIQYCKGDYFRITGPPPVKMPVYPVPSGHGLGIHLTPDLAGSVQMGPNAYYVSDINYRIESNQEDFVESVERYMPSIRKYGVHTDSSGIRPQLKTGKTFRDFIIRHESDRGLNGLIDLVGIESPGLTAAPAIGEYVSELFENEIRR